MQLLFSITLFVSALLLFLVQPMIGKMLMPLAGGTAAVWSTCIVFFQAALLGGYVYAHAGSRNGPRRFAGTHVALLTLPLIALAAVAAVAGTPLSPIKALAPHGQEYPFFSLVLLLVALIGLPFFFVSTSAPLLQKWYADTDAPGHRDPYFLYAASNLGSFVGLLLYPLVIERYLPMRWQAWAWAIGFGGFVGLTAACRRALMAASPPRVLREDKAEAVTRPVSIGEKLHWLILAAVPSSLMLSVTSYATTDLAPIPLFIVVPLGLYLLTFVIAFARPVGWLRHAVGVAAPLVLLVYVFLRKTDLDASYSLSARIGVVIGVFFLTALNCHMQLAHRRPAPRYLTEYYIWMSLGGVLGGLFNSLVAPIVFNQYAEFAVGLVVACFLVPPSKTADDDPLVWLWNRLFHRPARPSAVAARGAIVTEPAPRHPWASRVLDLVVPVAVGLLVYFLNELFKNTQQHEWLNSILQYLEAHKKESYYTYLTLIAGFGVPIMISYVFIERPWRFGLCVAAIFIAAELRQYDIRRTEHGIELTTPGTLVRTRSFFGALQVSEVDHGTSMHHKLVHGTTVHGQQQFDPPDDTPLTYYHPTGPMGDVMTRTPQGTSARPVGFIGLGTGSLTGYAKPGQSVTVYEIDPAIRRIAENPAYFTYVTDARRRGADVNIVMGDARLRLEEAEDGKYAVLAVDAFSSDSIPIHLLTKEAIQLYLQKTAEDGIIAIHVSNRYLRLNKVVARIASELGLPAYRFYDEEDAGITKSASDWIVVAKNEAALKALKDLPPITKTEDGKQVTEPHWERLVPDPDAPYWTDDFSNVLGVMRGD